MTGSLFLAALWALVANLLAMLPSRDNHWRSAYLLIALGIPLLGYVTIQNGPWIGMAVLAGGMSVLRWPLIRLARWTSLHLQGKQGDEIDPLERSS